MRIGRRRDPANRQPKLSLQEFVADLKEKGTRLNLVILHACHDNPFAQSSEAERAWPSVKDTASIAALEAFIRRFGDTYYGDLAKVRRAELKQTEAAKKNVEEAKARADAERQRLAMLKAEQDRKRADAEGEKKRAEAVSVKQQAAEAVKKKADDDARLERAAAKKKAEAEAQARHPPSATPARAVG